MIRQKRTLKLSSNQISLLVLVGSIVLIFIIAMICIFAGGQSEEPVVIKAEQIQGDSTPKSTKKNESIDLLEYILDPDGNLTKIKGADDQRYGPFIVPDGLPVLNTTYNKFYIETNGYILAESENSNQLLKISPFETDVDLRRMGAIVHGRIENEHLLDDMTAKITKACPDIQFRPNWAYVVTWFEVRPYFSYNGNNEFGATIKNKNTFQVGLVTDHVKSFVVFRYPSLEWPDLVIDRSFRTGYSVLGSNSNPLTFTFENKNVNSLLSYSNVGVPGERLLTFGC